MVLPSFFKKKSKREFNQFLWINFREKRIEMVDDLIQQGLLLQMTKKEVINFLGFEFNDNYSNIWTYFLGRKGFFIFSKRKSLIIYFDKQGLVYQVKLN